MVSGCQALEEGTSKRHSYHTNNKGDDNRHGECRSVDQSAELDGFLCLFVDCRHNETSQPACESMMHQSTA
jgi:hypothetical protein